MKHFRVPTTGVLVNLTASTSRTTSPGARLHACIRRSYQNRWDSGWQRRSLGLRAGHMHIHTTQAQDVRSAPQVNNDDGSTTNLKPSEHEQNAMTSSSSNSNSGNSDSNTSDTSTNTNTGTIDTRASTHLFASASHLEAEESAALSKGPHPLVARALAQSSSSSSSSNAVDVDVDAPTRTALLRARIEAAKFRPLREARIRSADEKLRARPPGFAIMGHDRGPTFNGSIDDDSSGSLRTNSNARADIRESDIEKSHSSDTASIGTYTPDWQRRAQEPLLPAVEGHRPWHTTFIAPTHATARVKLGVFPHSKHSRIPSSNSSSSVVEEPPAARLGRARESMLDYKLGIRGSRSEGAPRRPMPAGMKGWANLVEERIERARQQGQFRTLKGRGRPLVRDIAEGNPFIGREEFLMNRIVQRNNAAPAWVELQAELETATLAFRESLQESWTRRAVRMLTQGGWDREWLERMTVEDAMRLRDAEWEERERGYHSAAVEELNGVVRRYNGVAPAAVRRRIHERETELARAYKESAESIVQGVRERLSRPGGVHINSSSTYSNRSKSRSSGINIGIIEVVRRWFAR